MLSLKLNFSILDNFNTALVVFIVDDVTSNDEVLSTIRAMLLLTVPGDKVGILRYYRGSLLVHSTLPIVVDILERLGNDSDEQV